MENLDAEEIRLNQRLEEIRLAKIELTKPLVISLVDVKYGAFPSIEIKLSKHDQIVVEAMRWIPGRNYINQRQVNTFPIDSFDKVKQAIESTGNKLEISDELETKVNEYLNAVDFELDFIEKRSQIKVSRTIKQKRLDYIYDISSWTNHTDYYTFNVNELLKWMELQSKMTQYKFGMSDSVMKLYNEQIERERLTNEFAEMKDADIGGFAFRWTDKNGVEHSFDLKPDQRVACKFDDTFGNRTLLSFDMGKGKTAIAIAQAERYNERVLFICKADLKTNIKREIRKFTGKEAIVFSGIEPDGLDLEYMLGSKKQQYNILSYSVIGRTVTSEDSDGNKHELMKWVELINFSKFDRIICDEAHYIKNMDSQRSKGVRATHSPKTMLLTGTPIVNRPGELFPALNIIDPITFHDYASFLNQFTDYNGRPKNLPVLHKLLKRYMIRRLRDASNDPNRIPQYTSLSPKAQQRYAEVFEGLYTALRKPDYTSNVTNILTEMLRLKQICADDKVDFTVDLAETALDETEELPWNKVLVFSQFKATQAEIANRLGSQCRIINGEVTDKSRYELVDAFQDPSNKLKVIVTNIVEGLTLTQAGTTIINDLWWTPKDHSQAEGRAFGRENDPHGGNSYYVLAENTIDDMIWGLLEKKMKIAKAIVDDVYVKYDDNESLFSELTKMIRG